MLIKLFKKILQLFKQEDEIHYICGQDALPEPFCEEEEKEKIKQLSTGDEQVKKELIEHNLRLVVYIARKFENTGIDTDDLISVGTIGLIKAVGTFDGEKNIKLATYASRCIENEILMYLRRTSKTHGEISLDEPLNVDGEGNELLLSDILGTEASIVFDPIEVKGETDILKMALSKLSERESTIMSLRFGLGGRDEMTQKEVADYLGISQSYISRLEKKIVRKLKKEMVKYS